MEEGYLWKIVPFFKYLTNRTKNWAFHPTVGCVGGRTKAAWRPEALEAPRTM